MSFADILKNISYTPEDLGVAIVNDRQEDVAKNEFDPLQFVDPADGIVQQPAKSKSEPAYEEKKQRSDYLNSSSFDIDSAKQQVQSQKEKNDRVAAEANLNPAVAAEGGYKQRFASETSGPERDVYDYYFDYEDRNGAPEQNRLNALDHDSWIDDGTSAASREALFMTGEQYLKYRNQFGLPGRDTSQIDPYAIYNKNDEMNQYGFVPYLSNSDSAQQFSINAIPHQVANAFNDLANSRRLLTDYRLDYDGNSYSGKDLAKNTNLYNNQNLYSGTLNNVSEESQDEYSVPLTFKTYDQDGNPMYAPCGFSEYREVTDEDKSDPNSKNAVTVMVFNDGSRWYFTDNEVDENGNPTVLEYVETWRSGQDIDDPVAWNNVPPVELDDGQLVRADIAHMLIENQDMFADYSNGGKNNIFNPIAPIISLVENKLGVGSGANMGKVSVESPSEGVLPYLWDIGASSVPYFWKPAAAVKATSDVIPYLNGINPGKQDYLQGTYNLISENPTRSEANSKALASAVMPFTEYMWGPLGKALTKINPTAAGIKGVTNLISRGNRDFEPTAKAINDFIAETPYGQYLAGISDEGIEEIFGNLVEEWQNTGNIADYYADNALRLEENGEPETNLSGEPKKLFDSQGRLMKTPTSGPKRVLNFLADAGPAYLGGLLLSSVISAPGKAKEALKYSNDRQKFIADINKLGLGREESDALIKKYMDDFNHNYTKALEDLELNVDIGENAYQEYLSQQLLDHLYQLARDNEYMEKYGMTESEYNALQQEENEKE